MAPQDNNNFAALPRWALVAFIARCARRLLPLYEHDNTEPADQRMAVARAILLAEKRAVMGGSSETSDYEPLSSDGQFVDHYDIEALASALAGSEEAASNTFREMGSDEGKVPWSEMSIGQYTAVAQIALQNAPEPD